MPTASTALRMMGRQGTGVPILVLGAILLALPTFYAIAVRSWSTEQGQYGTLALAIGVYLLVRDLIASPAPARTPPLWPAIICAMVSSIAYLAGRIAGEYLLETYALYLAGLSVLLALVGFARLRRLWFPLAFIFLSLPMPSFLMIPLSSELRLWMAAAATSLLQAFGLNIGRDGLSLFVDSHQIDIQEACSGMNSLISVSLIALSYIHLARAPRPVYFAIMCAPIFLAAVLANFFRVIVVVLLTHGFGQAVGQSLLHEAAGLMAFATALGLVIGLDGLIGPAFERGRGEARA